MRILLVKTSSLGDVVHTLPAVTDLEHHCRDVTIDWVVEKHFAFVPALHPKVNRIIPVAVREWKTQPFSRKTYAALWQTIQALSSEPYDFVVDAQGLMKSAVLSSFAKGKRCGLDKASIRESWASWFYHKTFYIPKNQHAITRVRQLFAQVFGYPVPNDLPDYGVVNNKVSTSPYLIFLHGTSWPTKEWPEAYWRELLKLATEEGFEVWFPWANEAERQRVERIVRNKAGGRILPCLSLEEVGKVIAQAKGVVTVDTGLGHLAVALSRPTVSIYGPTDPNLTGTKGKAQHRMVAHFPCAPCLSIRCHYKGPSHVFPACFESIRPQAVWETLKKWLVVSG